MNEIGSDLADLGYRVFYSERSGCKLGGEVLGSRLYVLGIKRGQGVKSMDIILNNMEQTKPDLIDFLQPEEGGAVESSGGDTQSGRAVEGAFDHRSIFRELDLPYPPSFPSFISDVLELDENNAAEMKPFNSLTLRQKEVLYFVEHIAPVGEAEELVVDLSMSIKHMNAFLTKEGCDQNVIQLITPAATMWLRNNRRLMYGAELLRAQTGIETHEKKLNKRVAADATLLATQVSGFGIVAMLVASFVQDDVNDE